MNDLTLVENRIMACEAKQEVQIAAREYIVQLGQTVNKNDIGQMRENLMKYKALCDIQTVKLEKYIPMSFTTTWMILGFTQSEVMAIFAGRKEVSSEVKELLNQAKTLVLADREQAVIYGTLYPSNVIFEQKNYAEMSDYPEPVKVEIADMEALSPQEIAEKYKDILE